jgi:hypothetical protein
MTQFDGSATSQPHSGSTMSMFMRKKQNHNSCVWALQLIIQPKYLQYRNKKT